MEISFEVILLHTAFCCMACDGDIDPSEVELIKEYSKNESKFGSFDIDKELERLTDEINRKGKSFLKNYLYELSQFQMNEEQELEVLRVAAKMIQADNIVQYSEIKFFKIIRSELKVDDATILANVKDIDETYLAQDIKADYILFEDYFNNIEIPQFSTEILNQIKK